MLQFELLAPTRRPRAPRPPDPQPRRGADADLHARGHLRHRQGRDAALAGGDGRADHPGQHLPPVDAPRPGRARSSSAACTASSSWNKPDPHRLGRLPGLEPGRDAQDQRGRREVRVAGQRRQAVPHARDLDADPDRAEQRHRHAVRRVHALRDQGPHHDRGRGAHLDGAEPRWARRCQAEFARLENPNALFGIVQGGMFEHLREESLAALVEMDFPGYAVGGVSVGEPKDEMLRIMAHTPHRLPAHKPRYLMGVGTPEDLVEGVAARRGHVRLRDAHAQCAQRPPVHALRRPEDPQRAPPQRRASAGRDLHLLRLQGPHGAPTARVTGGFSRAYLHHLERCGEMLAPDAGHASTTCTTT